MERQANELEGRMNPFRRIRPCFLLCLSGLLLHPLPASPQTAAVTAVPRQLRDGQHDFDFHFGSWKTHIKLLLHPLSGSVTWVELDGTATVRKIWDGRASLEELEDGEGTTHFQGLTLLLYNPQSHQWSQSFANISNGTLGATPLIGEFKDGRGEFFGQDTVNGRTVQVRFVWSNITANSCHIERSFSEDGGRSWEPNFSADLTRRAQ
jgi:hypothetical protein